MFTVQKQDEKEQILNWSKNVDTIARIEQVESNILLCCLIVRRSYILKNVV